MSPIPDLYIPIIDLGPFTIPGYTGMTKEETLRQLAACCETIGCFYLTNHGISHELIKNTLDDCRTFMIQPLEYKQKYADPEGHFNRGYFGYEAHNLNLFMGRKGHPNDPLEKYLIEPPESNVSKVAENLWPDYPPTFKSNSCDYYKAMKTLSETLFRVLALAMDAPGYEDFVYNNCDKGIHRLKMQYYGSRKSVDNQLDRFPIHTDSNPFAILITQACPGSLQLLDERENKWHSIKPIDNMFVVNLGDTMERWTNGVWKAPVHKVAWPDNPTGPNRIGIIYFPHANPGTMLEAVPKFVPEGQKPRWEPISYTDYVAKKIQACSIGHLTENTGTSRMG